MFERELKAKLERIFDFPKTTFDAPGDASEQETLFINITHARCTVAEKKEHARVEGDLVAFVNSEKIPYGYFGKRIAQADKADTKPFFFHAVDVNDPVTNNIVRRTLKFVFFYQGQYDPNLGIIDTVNFSEG